MTELEILLSLVLAFIVGVVVGYFLNDNSNETYTRNDM